MTIVLDNIRSAWNVGSIFRTADAVGADIILIGYTPRPVGDVLKLIKKTAIGAENSVKWQHFEHYREVLDTYKDRYHIGLELSPKSINIYDLLGSDKPELETLNESFLWFGNEIHGLEPKLISELNETVFLPMKGIKESINVANCVCTVVYMIDFVLFKQAAK